jgi:hypothetical protein
VDAASASTPHRSGDVARRGHVISDLVYRQADAVSDQIAAVDCALGRLRVEHVGGHRLRGRAGESLREPLLDAHCDATCGKLAREMPAGRPGGAKDGGFANVEHRLGFPPSRQACLSPMTRPVSRVRVSAT